MWLIHFHSLGLSFPMLKPSWLEKMTWNGPFHFNQAKIVYEDAWVTRDDGGKNNSTRDGFE